MTINVNWDNDAKTVIRYDFQGQWNWDQFRTAANEAFTLTRSVQHRVDTISYFHAGTDVPSDAIFQFNRVMKTAPSNRGATVIVGGSVFISNLVGVFSKIYKPLGKRLMLASSLDDARKLLSDGAYKASKIEQ